MVDNYLSQDDWKECRHSCYHDFVSVLVWVLDVVGGGGGGIEFVVVWGVGMRKMVLGLSWWLLGLWLWLEVGFEATGKD